MIKLSAAGACRVHTQKYPNYTASSQPQHTRAMVLWINADLWKKICLFCFELSYTNITAHCCLMCDKIAKIH